MRKSSVLFAGAVLAASTVGGAAAATAKTYDPNVARVANPANACKSIPGTLHYLEGVIPGFQADLSGFSYSGCVSMLARGAAVVEPVEEFGNPYEQCDFLVSVGAITYPATLHSGEGGEEDAFLPDLTVKNRKQCGSALYAFHAIAEQLPAPPE